MSTLAGYRTDKGPYYHGFTELYESVLFPIKNDKLRILEIGVAEGGSLGLWADYFPNADIYGIDIFDKSAMNSDRITTFVADQANRAQLASFIEQHGGEYDIILDDGGHSMEQQQVSLGFLFQFVKPGGYYIVEDIHTSFYTDFGAEPDGSNTTYTMLVNFIGNVEIVSQYMTETERQDLQNNIEYTNLFFRNTEYQSIACVLRKKME